MAKKPVPKSGTGAAGAGVKKKVPIASRSAVRDTGLSDADCICATMKPHCPVHSGLLTKKIPAPGTDVIR